jgi:hypothetical protein
MGHHCYSPGPSSFPVAVSRSGTNLLHGFWGEDFGFFSLLGGAGTWFHSWKEHKLFPHLLYFFSLSLYFSVGLLLPDGSQSSSSIMLLCEMTLFGYSGS